ncbi:MAG: NADP-dependent phosphogluconate dehydrogenase [Vulcanimicrobiota bacterium]
MQDFGLIGLAVMGQNLVLNIERNGFSVSVFNRTSSKTEEFMESKALNKNIKAYYRLDEFIQSLKKPRKIMLMVKAGEPVDLTIEKIIPFLDTGDIILDGGNSHFSHTRRRFHYLKDRGINFLGVGVSGGEEGALNGPSIMPGGSIDAYDLIKDVFLKIAAHVDGKPCCTYVGNVDAGHFVKMVHNGIEYADMQIIAEAYDFLYKGMGLSVRKIRDTFKNWQSGSLNSYLIDITVEILSSFDPETEKPMLEVILDRARQKGTGKWAAGAALDLGIPVTVIDSAVFARNVSALKNERLLASEEFEMKKPKFDGDQEKMIQAIHDSLLCSKITAYSQGMRLIQQASIEYNYGVNLPEIARIWKGGCIIRAEILDSIQHAYLTEPGLLNLYFDPRFKRMIENGLENWKFMIIESIKLGIPCPAIVSALEYYESYTSKHLSANLIQAQRDYFGAHTFERTDREGSFHVDWDNLLRL